MKVGRVRVPSLSEFQRDTRLLLISSGIFSVGFMGVMALLKVLYVLRLGFGLEYVGIYTAMGALTYMTVSIPSGVLSLRFGMKPMLVMGGVLTTVGMLLLPMTEFVPAWAFNWWPILSQIVMTPGWALLSIIAVPALMSATTERTRDDAYALYSMLRGAGAFFGTMIGGLLPMMFAILFSQGLDQPAPYRWALLLGSVTGIFGLIPLMRLRNIDADDEEEADVFGKSGPFPLALVLILILHVFLIHGGVATVNAFGNAYMDTELHMSAAVIGFITSAGQFIAILAPITMPVLAARRSNAWTLMMAAAGSALFLLPLALVPTWFAAGIGRMGLLVVAAIWLPALQAFQMNAVAKHWRSLAYGSVSMGMGLAFGTVSLIGGFIAASRGYSTLFLIGVVLCIGGSFVMLAVRKVPAVSRLMEPVRTEKPVLSTPASIKAS